MQQPGFSGQNEAQYPPQQRNQGQMTRPLTQLYEHHYAGNHLIRMSLVFQYRNSDYKCPYFCFLSFCPAGIINGEKTYLIKAEKPGANDPRITFKMELQAMLEFGKALSMYAGGQGARMGKYQVWADPTKAVDAGDSTDMRTGKNFSLKDEADRRDTSQRVVNLCVSRGKATQGQNAQGGQSQKGQGMDNLVVTLRPHEAAALGDYAVFIATKGRELAFNRKMAWIKQQAAKAGQSQTSRQ